MQWFRRKVDPQKARAFCDDDGLKLEYPDHSTASIRWAEIMKIAVITTDQGLFVDDVFLAESDPGGVNVPSGNRSEGIIG